MPLIRHRPLSLVLLVAFVAAPLRADDAAATRFYHAADTVDLAIDAEPDAAARAMLQQLAWPPARFRVTVTPIAADPAVPAGPTAVVRFPSPRPDASPAARPAFNTVVLEWTPPASAPPKPDPSAPRRSGSTTADPNPPAAHTPAPAVLILHILDNRLLVERALARRLSQSGVHVFVMHLPGFGARRVGPFNAAAFFAHAAQAISDARRARDAIAALPGVAADRVALVGTSLGGFIAAPTASLDAAFSPVFIMLAGGDLHHVFTHGTREAALIRRHLESAGYVGPKLAALCATMEPTTLAHRLHATTTWLITASADQVVPRHSADAFAKAAHLPADHHLVIAADHYVGVIHLPWIADRIVAAVKQSAASAPAAAPGEPVSSPAP